MSALVLRLAEAVDLPAASALVCTTFLKNVAPLYKPEGIRVFLEYAAAEPWRERHVAGNKTWLAVEEGRIVGAAHFRGEAHLSMLFVDPDRQRQGIGRRLLELATITLPGREITVHASPNAVGAYQVFGFVSDGPEIEESGIRFVPMRKPPAPHRITGRPA